jgi:hypothetical protein
MTAKQQPPEPPFYVRAIWCVRVYLTWPMQVREMKRTGFRRIGWMTWELGPEES